MPGGRKHAASDVDAAHVLDLLEVGVMMLGHDLRVTYANARWELWIPQPLLPEASFEDLLGDGASAVIEELRGVLADGEPRTVHLTLPPVRADAHGCLLDALVRRVPDGLVLEVRSDSVEERAAMHDIARRLAEVSDMAEVLRALCDIAMRQCGGTGASVMRVLGEHGEVVASAGDMGPAWGRTFALEGSMLLQAISESEVIREENYSLSNRPLARAVPELAVGPVLMAPLKAHGETLGVIAVSRPVGGRAFRPRDIERLRGLADHAALAVHKSLLLLQAQSADRAKGRFLATMSHELRTPLTALAGYNELLADEVIGPLSAPQLDILERMRSVTLHLSAMIEEILSFTSLEEGREVVRPSEFLVADLVRAAVAIVEPMAEQKRIRLVAKLSQKPVRMTSDIEKSRQILVNLIGNAVKFTDSGNVTVSLSTDDSTVRIDVQDTGIGIPPEELARLFKPFVQVDAGLTRRHGGTGLGLYISRRLATLLGGRIDVTSTVGVGSTFSVVLPTRIG